MLHTEATAAVDQLTEQGIQFVIGCLLAETADPIIHRAILDAVEMARRSEARHGDTRYFRRSL